MLIGLLDDSSLPYYAGRALRRHVDTARGKHKMCRFELKVRYKLLLEVMLCIAAVSALDLGCSPLRFGGESWDIGAWGFWLSCFWLLGVMNAFNLIDGIDGLCGGTALLSLGSLAGIGWMLGVPSVALVAMAVGGAVLGFLYYNVSPARIFMGDMGSLFLGFVIGLLGLSLLKVPGSEANSLLPVVLAGLPVWDTCMAMARRSVDVPSGSAIGARLKRIVGPDSNHIHHRMLYMGLSHWKASLVLYTHHALLLSSGWLLVVVPQEMQKWVLLYWLGNGTLLFTLSYQMRRLRIWAKRLWLMLQGMNELPWRVGVVCASAELNDSLACQRRLPFEFFHVDRSSLTHMPSVSLHAVLVEQLPGESVEELLDFAVNFQTAWDMPMALVMASHEHSADYVKEHPYWKELKHKVAVFNRPLYLWPLLTELLDLLEKYHVARPTRSGERLAHTGNGAV